MAAQGQAAATGAQWTGRWCWTQKHVSRPWNQYACFRRVIDLRDKPQRAQVRVSADARYVLHVNGRRIHQGPARSWPEHQSFDTLDLAGALQPGHNTICAVVHQFGIPTFQSVYRGSSGFLLDGVVEVGGNSVPLHTPAEWLCQPSRAWRRDVARLSIQLGFQEHFDADAHPADWMSPDFAATEQTGWHKPADLGPVGSHPWINLEERGVPLIADHTEPFRAVAAQFSSENARGYKIADDVYHLAALESWRREKSVVENPQAMLQDGADATLIHPRPDGQATIVVLDLGQERLGHILLDVADAAGDEIIDILYTEALDKNGAPAIIGAAAPTYCEEATADRYRCRPGPQRWEPFHPKGFRYATLVFRNVLKPLKVQRVALRHVHAAVDEIGSFECSDERLNQIWRIGRETQRNCMLDAYIDTPWREQAQWWGDARVQFRVNAYTFGDVSLLERGIRQVARSQAPDGSLHAHPPADTPAHRLPDFMLTWVGTLWDHYFHTGRTSLLRECLPAMHRLFDFFARHEIRDGLVGSFPGMWVFLDWQPLYKDDFSGLLNMMYLQALRWAAAICYVLADEEKGEQYNTRSAALAASITQHFWDAKAKAWRDGFNLATNERIDAVSQHMNALAILLRVKPETHPAIAKEILLKPANSRRSKVITASPFFYAYVLEALSEANYRAEVVQIIRDKWGEMIDNGATTFWEIWEPEHHSRCHAWSASPVYHLSQQVLGVSPVDVGWKQVRIAPLPGKLEFARGHVPSPLGTIRVEWEQAAHDQLAVRVDLPQGMEAEFVGPLGEIRSLEPGAHEFHT